MFLCCLLWFATLLYDQSGDFKEIKMINIFCDDGSTNVKLAWFENDILKTYVSPNSFRHGWKVDFGGGIQLHGLRPEIHLGCDQQEAVSTTNVEYQYGDLNLLAVHHALLNCGLSPQDVSLTVTLPLSEYYDQDCQKNEENISRKKLT